MFCIGFFVLFFSRERNSNQSALSRNLKCFIFPLLNLKLSELKTISEQFWAMFLLTSDSRLFNDHVGSVYFSDHLSFSSTPWPGYDISDHSCIVSVLTGSHREC